VDTYAAAVAVVVAVVGLVVAKATLRIFAKDLYSTVPSAQQEQLAGLVQQVPQGVVGRMAVAPWRVQFKRLVLGVQVERQVLL
jgi:hypothetical protein